MNIQKLSSNYQLFTRAYQICLLVALSLNIACETDSETPDIQSDRTKLDIQISGSLQNPAWSPDGGSILFTRFHDAYNEGSADLMLFDLSDNSLQTLLNDGSSNVNLPGSVWHAETDSIVFSSTHGDHDEIYLINSVNKEIVKITDRDDYVAYEPSLSPDGKSVVFESHPLDVEEQGVITIYDIDRNSDYRLLTKQNEDCRQPNWSPTNNAIVFQCFADNRWDLWLINPDGSNRRQLTKNIGNNTDASFSPDGQRIVYSSENEETDYASLYIISVAGGTPTRLSFDDSYDGAASWSPDGSEIIYESYSGDPDGSVGTELFLIDAP